MRKGLLRALSMLLIMALCLLPCSCGGKTEYCEIGIVLPDGFKESEAGGGFDRVYSSGTESVGIFRISFDAAIDEGISTTMSAMKFAEYYRDESGLVTDILQDGTVAYFIHVFEDADGTRYFHLPTFYRTPYAYFVIIFTAVGDYDAEVERRFLDIASTVYLID